jgi:hypothetical protein
VSIAGKLADVWDVTTKATGGMTPDSPFPWGKHKGTPVNRVPRDYLVWAVNNADHMRPELKAVVCQVLGITPDETKQGNEDPAASGLREAWEAATRRVREQEREIKGLKAQLATGARLKRSDTDRFRAILASGSSGSGRPIARSRIVVSLAELTRPHCSQ